MHKEINFLIDNIDPDYGITNNVFSKIKNRDPYKVQEILSNVFSGFSINYVPSFFHDRVSNWIYPVIFSVNNYVYLNSLFNSANSSLSIYNNIPEKIVKELENDKGKLLIIMTEPFPDFRQFVKICKSNFPDVLFMACQYADAPNFFAINTFPTDTDFQKEKGKRKLEDDISNYPDRNFSIFLSNYQESFERKFILHKLEKTNLLSKGFISAENNARDFNVDNLINDIFIEDLIHNIKQGTEYAALYATKKSDTNIKLTFNSYDEVFNFLPIKEALEKSLFNIVLETEYYYVDHMIITEKIYRCFKYKKPFIVFSQHNIIKHLNDIGFKTFTPVFNESYDNYSDPCERFYKFFKEIYRLGSKSFSNLREEIDSLENILEHNKNFLIKSEEKTKNEILRIVSNAK